MIFKKTGKVYAIKEMSKTKIIDKNSVDSIQGEREILSYLHHPFIVNMVYAFQDRDYLYLVMDLLPGGNLRYHLGLKKRFTEEQTSKNKIYNFYIFFSNFKIEFFIACILVGLEYIHKSNIIHRDIKPENLVFDSKGYVRITDFGIAKKYVINNKKDTSGTVGYLAPEVLLNENHNFSIDYYSVGIITFEFIFGHRPYLGKNKHEVKQLVLTKQAQIDYEDLPEYFMYETADFVNGLIQRKPKNRLGKNGISNIINHPWFEGFNWENLKKKKLKSPYIPKNGDNFNKKYCLAKDKEGNETLERYIQIKNDSNFDDQFKFFSSTKIPNELKINLNYSPDSIHNSSYTNNISRNRNDSKNDVKTQNICKNLKNSIFESSNSLIKSPSKNNSEILEKYHIHQSNATSVYGKHKILRNINKNNNLNGTFYLNKDINSILFGINGSKKKNSASSHKRVDSSRSMQSLKYIKNSNDNYQNNNNSNDNSMSMIYGKNNNINFNSINKRNLDKSKLLLDKKLPNINISLSKKKSVFGNYVFNHDNNQEFFAKLSDRNKQKSKNMKMNLDILKCNEQIINKSMSLTKRQSNKKKSLFDY